MLRTARPGVCGKLPGGLPSGQAPRGTSKTPESMVMSGVFSGSSILARFEKGKLRRQDSNLRPDG